MNYRDGTWGEGKPNSTRTGAPKPSELNESGNEGGDNNEYAFPDVDVNTWHADDIQRIYEKGITTGYPDGTFRPMFTVARCDMAAFLHKRCDLEKNPLAGA